MQHDKGYIVRNPVVGFHVDIVGDQLVVAPVRMSRHRYMDEKAFVSFTERVVVKNEAGAAEAMRAVRDAQLDAEASNPGE